MSRANPQGLLLELQKLRAELRRFLVARTGSESEADDLLSELWIKISVGTPGPISSPKAYLFRMTNNLALDRARERRRRERREQDWTADQFGTGDGSFEVADPARTVEQALIDREEVMKLAEAIGQVPEGARRVLRMHKLEGLSHGEVAERLGITKSAVEKHMAVAMTHLRRLLGS